MNAKVMFMEVPIGKLKMQSQRVNPVEKKVHLWGFVADSFLHTGLEGAKMTPMAAGDEWTRTTSAATDDNTKVDMTNTFTYDKSTSPVYLAAMAGYNYTNALHSASSCKVVFSHDPADFRRHRRGFPRHQSHDDGAATSSQQPIAVPQPHPRGIPHQSSVAETSVGRSPQRRA